MQSASAEPRAKRVASSKPGFESASHSLGRTWEEAEPDLEADWGRYEHRGENPSAWEEIEDAVKDAWDRVTDHRNAAAN